MLNKFGYGTGTGVGTGNGAGTGVETKNGAETGTGTRTRTRTKTFSKFRTGTGKRNCNNHYGSTTPQYVLYCTYKGNKRKGTLRLTLTETFRRIFDVHKPKSPSLHPSRDSIVKKPSQACVSLIYDIPVLQVGVWHEQHGISFARNFTESLQEIVESLQNKTLVVTTIRVSWEYDL